MMPPSGASAKLNSEAGEERQGEGGKESERKKDARARERASGGEGEEWP